VNAERSIAACLEAAEPTTRRRLGELIARLGALGLVAGARSDGRPIGPAALAGVDVRDPTEDSRRVGPGALFVALRGSHVDGHEFVAPAFAAGAAAALVEEQRAALAAIEPDERGLTALWWSSGDDTPYVGAGIGAPQMIMEAAGLTNVAADVHDTWTSLGWENVVEADPDVIVLVDAAWNPADAKIEALEANPATREMSAVKEELYVVVPFPATEAGVRNVDAVASVVDQLADLGL